ncbi:hypothetical protein DOR57_01315 [Salmonella enterica subsp. salamae]|nr:hypothetical protein [Salmonella enterica subsp. salamae]
MPISWWGLIGLNMMPVASKRFPQLNVRLTTSLLSSGVLAVPVISKDLLYFQSFHRLIFNLSAQRILIKWKDKDSACFDFTGLMI